MTKTIIGTYIACITVLLVGIILFTVRIKNYNDIANVFTNNTECSQLTCYKSDSTEIIKYKKYIELTHFYYNVTDNNCDYIDRGIGYTDIYYPAIKVAQLPLTISKDDITTQYNKWIYNGIPDSFPCIYDEYNDVVISKYGLPEPVALDLFDSSFDSSSEYNISKTFIIFCICVFIYLFLASIILFSIMFKKITH